MSPRQVDLAGDVVEAPDVEYEIAEPAHKFKTRHFKARIPQSAMRGIVSQGATTPGGLAEIGIHMEARADVTLIPEGAWEAERALIGAKVVEELGGGDA